MSAVSKHTPGPWNADRVHPDWPECPVRYVDGPENGWDDICTLFGGEDGAKVTADAKLIAAAPDLLAALEPFAMFACDEPNDCPNCRARAAIKKARDD